MSDRKPWCSWCNDEACTCVPVLHERIAKACAEVERLAEGVSPRQAHERELHDLRFEVERLKQRIRQLEPYERDAQRRSAWTQED